MTRVKKNKATEPTGKRIDELLPKVLGMLGALQKERPDLVLGAWPEVIGSRFASMTKAESFVDGILTIKVRNSTLLSLLAQHEKGRLLQKLKEKFPQCTFRNIVFRIG